MLPPMPTIPAGTPPVTPPTAVEQPAPAPLPPAPDDTVAPEATVPPAETAAPEESAAPEQPVAPEEPPAPEQPTAAEEPAVESPVSDEVPEPEISPEPEVTPELEEPAVLEPAALEQAEPARTPRAAVLSLLGLAVVVAILLALVTVRLSDRQGANSGQADVTSAASSAVATVLSYDYRHLSADFAAAEQLLTPSFRKQYDATTAKGVEPLESKYKAVSTASANAAGIVSLSGSRAVVLVFVQQTVTNTQLSAPRLDRSRVDVSLVKSGSRWLIDKLTPL